MSSQSSFKRSKLISILATPYISESCIKIKINLNFHFHTSLKCFRKFYNGFKGLHKTFWDTKNKFENKNLNSLFLFVWDRDGKCYRRWSKHTYTDIYEHAKYQPLRTLPLSLVEFYIISYRWHIKYLQSDWSGRVQYWPYCTLSINLYSLTKKDNIQVPWQGKIRI